MAPQNIPQNGSTNGEDEHRLHTTTILVTGFGPFQDRYPVNPSFEIAQLLPDNIRTANHEIRVIAHPTPIRVCYEEVQALVPVLYELYGNTIDLVLHIGMASGRQYYAAELNGHRDGYHKNKDLDKRTLPLNHGIAFFSDCPPVMTTSLDYDLLMDRWRSNITSLPDTSPAYDADCRASDDAGNYLCDYIYFNSLAWWLRKSKESGLESKSHRPVLFLHVPAESDIAMLEKGKEVTVALIKAMGDVLHEQSKLEL